MLLTWVWLGSVCVRAGSNQALLVEGA